MPKISREKRGGEEIVRTFPLSSQDFSKKEGISKIVTKKCKVVALEIPKISPKNVNSLSLKSLKFLQEDGGQQCEDKMSSFFLWISQDFSKNIFWSQNLMYYHLRK